MQYRRIEYFDIADIAEVPPAFRLIWSDFVLDSRTIRASDLKKFAEAMGLWGDMQGAPGAHSDAVIANGTDGADNLSGLGHSHNMIFGADGDDRIDGNGGNDFLIGNHGNDVLDLGGGFFNRGKGGDGHDKIIGGAGIDWVHGNDGHDRLILRGGNDKGYGGKGNDLLKGGGGKDWLQGAMGHDTLIGGGGNDTLHGGSGDDLLIDRRGRDWLNAGAGDDHLIVRSDAGTPDMKLGDPGIAAMDLDAWTDRLTGGSGADEFHFIYEMNTTDAVAARNLRPDGTVDWMQVMRENTNPHDHWVDWGGLDRIDDFEFAEGDTIILEGHTVAADVAHIDRNNDGIVESSLVTVFSDQAAQMQAMGMGGMRMAHDRDFLGQILVENALLSAADLEIRSMSMEARFDEL